MPTVAAQCVERARVDRALGEPELVPHQPVAIVRLAAVHGAAARTGVRIGRPWIVIERSAVGGTAAAGAREARFLAGDLAWNDEQPLEVGGQRVGERSERTIRDALPLGELRGGDEKAHRRESPSVVQ